MHGFGAIQVLQLVLPHLHGPLPVVDESLLDFDFAPVVDSLVALHDFGQLEVRFLADDLLDVGAP